MRHSANRCLTPFRVVCSAMRALSAQEAALSLCKKCTVSVIGASRKPAWSSSPDFVAQLERILGCTLGRPKLGRKPKEAIPEQVAPL